VIRKRKVYSAAGTGMCLAAWTEEEVNPAMLDAMRDTMTANVLQALKHKPASVDAVRWIPRLIDEIERLRECLKDREKQRAV
jgi:hypothetical protein